MTKFNRVHLLCTPPIALIAILAFMPKVAEAVSVSKNPDDSSGLEIVGYQGDDSINLKLTARRKINLSITANTTIKIKRSLKNCERKAKKQVICRQFESFTLNSRSGNDTVNFDSSSKLKSGVFGAIFDSGSGNDTINATAVKGPGLFLFAELRDGDDTFTSQNTAGFLQLVDAGNGNDTVTTGDGDEYIVGGYGNDRLDGGGGTDSVLCTDADNPLGIKASLSTGSCETTNESDEISNFEDLYGTRYDDVLEGDADKNSIDGQGGNDQIDGLDGDDTLQASGGVINGGDGNDQIESVAWIDVTEPFDLSSSNRENMDQLGGLASSYEESQPITVNGNDGDDRIDGSSLSDTLNGGAGNDLIYGLNGNDTIATGEGKDTAFGGDNDDIIDSYSDAKIQQNTKPKGLLTKLLNNGTVDIELVCNGCSSGWQFADLPENYASSDMSPLLDLYGIDIPKVPSVFRGTFAVKKRDKRGGKKHTIWFEHPLSYQVVEATENKSSLKLRLTISNRSDRKKAQKIYRQSKGKNGYQFISGKVLYLRLSTVIPGGEGYSEIFDHLDLR